MIHNTDLVNNPSNQNSDKTEGVLFVKVNQDQILPRVDLGQFKHIWNTPIARQQKTEEFKALDEDNFKHMLKKISTLLDDVLSVKQEENQLSNGYSLDEIEINLGIEAGAQFFVTAKGNAGFTLKYKRKG